MGMGGGLWKRWILSSIWLHVTMVIGELLFGISVHEVLISCIECQVASPHPLILMDQYLSYTFCPHNFESNKTFHLSFPIQN